jgi:hypothetical protein
MSWFGSFHRLLVRSGVLAASAWWLASAGLAGVQDSVFSVGADGNVAFDVRDVARRDVLQRLLQGRAVEVEWVDPAFADERITGVFSGSADAVLRRLLAQTDFVAVYDGQGGKPRIARLIIVGKATSPGKTLEREGINAPPLLTAPPMGAGTEASALKPASGPVSVTPPSPADVAVRLIDPAPAGAKAPALVPPSAADRAFPYFVPPKAMIR